MDALNWRDWYTDLADVYRVQAVKEGDLTRHERVQVLTGVPCRIYRSGSRAIQMEQTAAHVRPFLSAYSCRPKDRRVLPDAYLIPNISSS